MLRFKLDYRFKCNYCGREHYTYIKRVIVEPDAIEMIGECLKELNIGYKGLIVQDINTKRIAGDRLKQILKEENFKVYSVIIERPDEKNINKVESEIIRCGVDFVLGVGGTSVLDVAKAAAWKASKFNKKIPYLSFSTTAANDGLSSAAASIYEEKSGVENKVSKATAPPLAVIVDLRIILKTLENPATAWMIPAGCGDIIGKLTALKDWEMGKREKEEYYCEYIAGLTKASIDDVLKNSERIAAGELEGLREQVYSLISSGVAMILAGSSRPCSGAEHLFSHYLDLYAIKKGLPLGRHGEQVAVGERLMALHYIKHNLEGWWKEAKYQPEAILQFFKQVKCPYTISQIKISKENAVEALVNAPLIRPERYTILHKKPLNKKEASSLVNEIEAG
ncbi:iron-containing alcohol dehydrogenase [Candidatus Bathyarchaeota archaeon]|nr:iron-containing alcohol dehydrogenase [Candidatus Bathyarchaeota archaeon]